MRRGTAFIINSAPGVGKSTLMRKLHLLLPDGFAIIDGDDVGRVIPYRNNLDWLNLMQDNIADCCANYKRYGFPNCVVGFVFPVQERLERITQLLEARGFDTVHILLGCEGHEIRDRITKRNTSRIVNIEQAVALNRELATLHADLQVDTTSMNPDAVADRVCQYILEVTINEVD